MRKTSYGVTAVFCAVVLILNILASTRTDWLVYKTPEIFHTKIIVRYGLRERCETKVISLPDSDTDRNYTEKSCRRFPLTKTDECQNGNERFCASWTSAGYAVELGIGFSAVSLVAIMFGVSTHSRRRRIWRAVAGLVALQGELLLSILCFSSSHSDSVTDMYRTGRYPTFDQAKPGTAYVVNTISWIASILIVIGVVTTGISADQGHRWAAGNRAYRQLPS
ncbi:hypothetical protein EV421DRAFT_1931595 [Armillaria borealis]|uniref:Uncharacterized protein n=1 Tax=Armillaria borealis TaxID=47425 RepID=A0AA39JQ57_9AGAR|nr:hypothetical protein EV421DRAFT_1931595 [Armillaria borealis]